MNNTFQLLDAMRELYEWQQNYKRCLEKYGPDHYKTAYARGGLTAAETMYQIMGGEFNENQKTEKNL